MDPVRAVHPLHHRDPAQHTDQMLKIVSWNYSQQPGERICNKYGDNKLQYAWIGLDHGEIKYESE